jgi:hypothetical protein
MISLGIGKPSIKRLPPSAPIVKALLETVAWCLSRSTEPEELRSVDLDPSTFLRIPPSNEFELNVWIEKQRESYQRAVQVVSERRSDLVRNAGIETADLALAQSKGRLLLYEPMETVDDGAAADSSNGFFDLRDAPPWDTWFAYSGDSIFCWVPGSLIQNAQAGIDANPVDCIHWCDWSRLEAL